MKKCFLAALAMACLLLSASPVFAQSRTTEITGNVPFAIFNITVPPTTLTSTSATVNWQTNAGASSQVFCDLASHSNAADYSYSTILESAEIESHSQTITGLAAATTYHVRVQSISSSFGTITSDDLTFVTRSASISGGGGGGGNGSGDTNNNDDDKDTSNRIYVYEYLDSIGNFTQDLSARSPDSVCTLIILKGTTARAPDGSALKWLSITPVAKTGQISTQPENGFSLGSNYNLQPEGATFSPEIIADFNYLDSQVPAGASENDLVIGYWDSEANQWVPLTDCEIDPEKNVISAQLKHFSIYSILAIPPRVTTFSIGKLNISPAEVKPGELVTITSVVTNTGAVPGDYNVSLVVNNNTVKTQKVSPEPGRSLPVSFGYSPTAAGTYQVKVNGLTGSFKAVLPPEIPGIVLSDLTIYPLEAKVGQEVDISAKATNRGSTGLSYRLNLMLNNRLAESREISIPAYSSIRVNFKVTPKIAGTYSVSIENLSSVFKAIVPPAMAVFTLSDLVVSPSPARVGEDINVRAFISNSGDMPGAYQIQIKLDNQVVKTDTVLLAGRANREIDYTIKPGSGGTHVISMNQLSSELQVQVPGVAPFYWPLLIGMCACVATATVIMVIRTGALKKYGIYR